jgi:hypothetical protein
MFYQNESLESRKKYKDSLSVIGSLSNLFSDSKTPYLYYRVAEKVFCNSFLAEDLSRGDVALDAHKNKIGIGLKTFLAGNYRTFQKVAEFNKDKHLYEGKTPQEIVHIIASLRNHRIEFTEKIFNIEESYYHCVIRDEHAFKIYEEPMDLVNFDAISGIKQKRNIIKFHDNLHEYSFNLSKSTLTKRFVTDRVEDEFEVKILANPLQEIQSCFASKELQYTANDRVIESTYLPLYGKDKNVYERSGLNQWNASGRERDVNEVYIPIPAKVHQLAKDFFPPRDEPFELILPNGKSLRSKVCQDSSKALMSYSNKALGKWILREVLSLKEGELLTYDKLQQIGVDSVRIDKISKSIYKIHFASIDSYENYVDAATLV